MGYLYQNTGALTPHFPHPRPALTSVFTMRDNSRSSNLYPNRCPERVKQKFAQKFLADDVGIAVIAWQWAPQHYRPPAPPPLHIPQGVAFWQSSLLMQRKRTDAGG